MLSQAARLLFRLLGEQLGQGQRAYGRYRSGGRDPSALGDDVWECFHRLLRTSQDFLDLLGRRSPRARWEGSESFGGPPFYGEPEAPFSAEAGASEPRPWPEEQAEPYGPYRETAAGLDLVLEVVCALPTRVRLDLQSVAFVPRRTLEWVLDSEVRDRARIEQDWSWEDGRPQLRLWIPEDHPEGWFSGSLIDPVRQNPAGNLAVRVGSREPEESTGGESEE